MSELALAVLTLTSAEHGTKFSLLENRYSLQLADCMRKWTGATSLTTALLLKVTHLGLAQLPSDTTGTFIDISLQHGHGS